MSNDPACMTLATEGECIGQWRCGGWFGCIFGDEMIRQSRHDWVTFDEVLHRFSLTKDDLDEVDGS